MIRDSSSCLGRSQKKTKTNLRYTTPHHTHTHDSYFLSFLSITISLSLAPHSLFNFIVAVIFSSFLPFFHSSGFLPFFPFYNPSPRPDSFNKYILTHKTPLLFLMTWIKDSDEVRLFLTAASLIDFIALEQIKRVSRAYILQCKVGDGPMIE